MINEKFPKNIDVSFQKDDDHSLSEQIDKPKNHTDVGPSSLYGRIGDNITYVTPGAYKHGYLERMWSWIWGDLLAVFIGLLRLFFTRER